MEYKCKFNSQQRDDKQGQTRHSEEEQVGDHGVGVRRVNHVDGLEAVNVGSLKESTTADLGLEAVNVGALKDAVGADLDGTEVVDVGSLEESVVTDLGTKVVDVGAEEGCVVADLGHQIVEEREKVLSLLL